MSTLSSYIFLILSLFILIETVQSATRVFTYDDGRGSDEHCCLVRVRDQVCLATPVTRSLLQVNKQCPVLAGEKVRRPKKNNKIMNRIFLDRISRRLNIEAVREQTDHILIELQKPLDSDILNRDLVCLASRKHALNLNRCFVEIFNPIENEKLDEKISLRKFSENLLFSKIDRCILIISCRASTTTSFEGRKNIQIQSGNQS